jgi:hypothetical protein
LTPFTGERLSRVDIAEKVQHLADMADERASRHEWKAGAWGWIYYLFAIPSTALAAAAAISLVADYSTTLAAALAGASAILTAMLTLLRPLEEAAAHHRAWARYQRLQEDAELLADIARAPESADPTLQEEFRKLLDRKSQLAEASPRAALILRLRSKRHRG